MKSGSRPLGVGRSSTPARRSSGAAPRLPILRQKGKHIPDIALAGGFINETQIFKAIAMSNLGDGHGPYIKTISMARAPLTAAMKADYFVELAGKGSLPHKFAQLYGANPEHFFVSTMDFRNNGATPGKDLPWPAMGVYTYLTDRVAVGLKQLMAGARKWRLDLLDCNDIAALTPHAARVTGVKPLWESNEEAMARILDF